MPLPLYLEHFTDRQDQIAAFDALWPGDGRWLLAFSGVSGNGKSTVLFLDTYERFAEASPPPTVARLWQPGSSLTTCGGTNCWT